MHEVTERVQPAGQGAGSGAAGGLQHARGQGPHLQRLQARHQGLGGRRQGGAGETGDQLDGDERGGQISQTFLHPGVRPAPREAQSGLAAGAEFPRLEQVQAGLVQRDGPVRPELGSARQEALQVGHHLPRHLLHQQLQSAPGGLHQADGEPQ